MCTFTRAILLLMLVTISMNFEFPISKNRVTMEKVICKVPPGSKVSYLHCKVKYINRNDIKIDVWGNISAPVHGLFARGYMYLKYNTYQRNGGTVYMNICDWLAGTSGNFIMDWIMPKMQKYTNINHPCPYVGEFYVKVDNISANMFAFPQIMPSGRHRVETVFFEKDEKDEKVLLNLSIFGSISDHRIEIV